MGKSSYDYSSEAHHEIRSERASGPKKKKGDKKLKRSKLLGMIMAFIQLLVSVAFIGLLVYKNLNFITLNVTIGIGVVLLVLLLIVVFMQTRSLGIKRAGKVISLIIIIILGIAIYLIYPLEKMSGKAVSEDPFVVFVSASDQFGELSTTSNQRSDTDIIAVVCPKTSTVLLVSTPRDYYIELKAKGIAPDSYDKLTHAGLYGNGVAYKTVNGKDTILSSSDWKWAQEVSWQPGHEVIMNSLQNLYGFKVDKDKYHYVQLNFTGFANLIDALGGITVDVEKGFTTHTYANYEDGKGRKDYTYKKGEMKMDGATALTYARERHSFAAGDMQRNKNQIAVLNAMTDKLLSGTTLLHYNKIMDSIQSSFSTDIDISSMVSLQTGIASKKDYDGWEILSFNVIGQPSRGQLTWNGLNKAIVLQDKDSIDRATDLINMMLNNDDAQSVKDKIKTYNKEQGK